MKRKYNRFFNLLTGKDRVEQPRNFVNESRTEATIYIYDEISYWWLSAEWFVGQLNSMLDIPTIHVRINSPGGDIFEARAMQITMAQHPSTIIAHIDGMAASAASFLIRGANRRVISDGGFLMIHQGMSGAYGKAQDLISRGKALEQIDDSMIESYVKVTGKDKEQVRAWVEAETWFGASTALEHGFVDEIVEAEPIENSFDLSSIYKNVPESLVNISPEPKAEPEPKQEYDFSANQRELELLEMDI